MEPTSEIRVRPGQSLSSAVATAPVGSRVLVEPGIYRESVVITKPLELIGVAPRSRVEFVPADGPCLTIQSDQVFLSKLGLITTSQSVPLLEVQGNDSVIENCSFSGGKTTVQVTGSTITLSDCEITAGYVGLHLNNCKHVDIVDCVVKNHRDIGVWLANLDRSTRLIRTTVTDNHRDGIIVSSTEPFPYYGPELYQCIISGNRADGIQLLPESAGAGLKECRIVSNGRVGLALGAKGFMEYCEISGGTEGIVISGAGGYEAYIGHSTIHHTPVGIRCLSPYYEMSRASVMSCRIHHTTRAGIQTASRGALFVGWCIVADNTGIGVDIAPNTELAVRECVISRNHLGILIHEQADSTITESIIENNHTGIEVRRTTDEKRLSYCRIRNNTRAVLVRLGANVVIMDCTVSEKGSRAIWVEPGGNIRYIGDVTVDHLARRNVNLPRE